MRRKKLISLEKPTPDLVEYRFRLLFLPYLLYAISIAILGGFIAGVFLCLVEPINKAVSASIVFVLAIISVEILFAYVMSKIARIVFTLEGKFRYHLPSKSLHVNLREINLVKPYQLFGIRCLDIKTTGGKRIQFSPRFYETAKILDRVRELAGEDHILVRALEKELSRPRYELTKLWVGVISSIVLTISIYLIGGNMYAAEQEKPLEQAIASYVRQHPQTAPNQSAINLQALMAKLGLSVEGFGDGTEVKGKPDQATISEWKSIEPSFKKYLAKQLETKELIDPLPAELVKYLDRHKTDIEKIETHLIDNPIPYWGSDIGWIEKSDPKAGDSPYSKWTDSINLLFVENLMILNIIDKQSLPPANIFRNLAAIEKIQKSFQNQPSLLSQLAARIGERKISDLVRRVDQIPTGWGNSLFSVDRHSLMHEAVVIDSMNVSRMLQNETIFNQVSIDEKSPLRFIPGYYKLARPHIRLGVVARHQEVLKGLDYWSKQNICRTNGQAGLAPVSILGMGVDYQNSVPDLASQYHKVLRSDLRWEATNAIRQVKAKLAAGEKVDRVANEFKIQSQVCPGEQWTAKALDGSVNLSFSRPPDWKALAVNNVVDIEPLTYKIKPLDRN